MNATPLKKPRRPPFTSYSELTKALDAATARAEKAEAENEKLKDEILAIGAKPMFYQSESYASVRAKEIQQHRELEYVRDIRARAERAEAECLEQARLLGMSASREASLLGKISQLERQLAATRAAT